MTGLISFKGKIMWPRNLFVPDEFRGQSNYKVNIIPDEESMKKFKDSGIRTAIKNTPEGEEYILLKRPSAAKVFENGTSIGGGAPKVFDKDGNDFPKDQAIGNGSVVEVLVNTYKGGDFIGHRVESVTILEYIPYVNEAAREVAEEPAAPKAKETKKVPF